MTWIPNRKNGSYHAVISYHICPTGTAPVVDAQVAVHIPWPKGRWLWNGCPCCRFQDSSSKVVRRVQERKKNRRRETTLKRLGMKTPLSTKWPAKHVAKSCWILHHIFLGQNLFSHPNTKQTLTFHLLLPCLQLICVAGFSEVQRCFLTALSPVLGALFVSTGLGVRSWIILIEGKLLVKWGDFFSTSYNLTQKNTYITF